MNWLTSNTLVITYKHFLIFTLVLIVSTILVSVNYLQDDYTRTTLMSNFNNGDVNFTMKSNIKDILNIEINNFVNESIFCLYGNYTENIVNIKDIKILEKSIATRYNVSYYPCGDDEDYLGTIHSHPPGDCVVSPQDFYQFGADGKERNYEAIITGIVCEDNFFVFHGASNVNDPIYLRF